MKLFPSSKVEAELNYLEFHNTKGSLANGTYRVIEADGDVSYAVLGDFRGTLIFDIKWFTEAEYESAIQEQAYDQRQDAFFDRELDEELMDSWDIAMIADEGRRRADEIPFDDHDLEGERWNEMVANQSADDSHALDDSQAVCADVAADKTIGELLRESMRKEPTEYAQKVSSTGIDCDTSGLKTVFKDGVVVNEESMETIRERTLENLHDASSVRPNVDVTDIEFEQYRTGALESNEAQSKAFNESMAGKDNVTTDVVRDLSADCYLRRGHRG